MSFENGKICIPSHQESRGKTWQSGCGWLRGRGRKTTKWSGEGKLMQMSQQPLPTHFNAIGLYHAAAMLTPRRIKCFVFAHPASQWKSWKRGWAGKNLLFLYKMAGCDKGLFGTNQPHITVLSLSNFIHGHIKCFLSLPFITFPVTFSLVTELLCQEQMSAKWHI